MTLKIIKASKSENQNLQDAISLLNGIYFPNPVSAGKGKPPYLSFE